MMIVRNYFKLAQITNDKFIKIYVIKNKNL